MRPDAGILCHFRRTTVSFAEDKEMRKKEAALDNPKRILSRIIYARREKKKERIILDIYYSEIKTRWEEPEN